MRIQFGLLGLTLAGAMVPGLSHAATAECMSADGACEASNDMGDWIECDCADGSGIGVGGGMEWVGYTEAELEEVCDEHLALFCGTPLTGVMCSGMEGSCNLTNEPFDWVDCECADGSGYGGGGGMSWAGLTEAELELVCEDELAAGCAAGPPPPSGVACGAVLGACVVDNVPVDSVECECADGSVVGSGGGMMWGGLSDDELALVCEEQIEELCGEDGETEGETEGETAGETTDAETAGTTDAETAATTGGETAATTGDQATTGGEGGNEGTTGGEGGHEGTGSASQSSTGGEETAGEEGGADGGDGGGGCSVASRGGVGAWAFMLLGLAGLGWRRRKA